LQNFKLEELDEYTHPPTAEPHFNESVYANGFDKQSGVGGWMRLGNRVNEGYAELSACLYLPDGRVACQFQRPSITSNSTLCAGGLEIEVINPLRQLRMTYEGEVLILDDPNLLREPKRMFEVAQRVSGSVSWNHETASPLHGGIPTSPDVDTMYGREFSLGHFNLHTRVTGQIELGSEKWPIDGYGWRDHSWGPRLWQKIFYYRLFIANFGDGRGFMLLKITNTAGQTRDLGVLMVNHEYEDIQKLDVRTEWTAAKDPKTVRVVAQTGRRTVEITGEVISLAPLRNRREIDGQMVTSRVAEGHTRFSWDGKIGHGMSEYIERLSGGSPVGYPQ
jgi:hypothetical protein